MVTEINDFDAIPRKFEINCDNRAVVAITDRDNRQNTRRLADQTRSRFQSVPRRLCHGRVPGKIRLRPAREQTFMSTCLRNPLLSWSAAYVFSTLPIPKRLR